MIMNWPVFASASLTVCRSYKYGGIMEIRIIDTTLRDGEQQPGLALDFNDKIEIAKLLNSIGIYQIEAGIPAIGGEEKKSIEKIVELKLNSRISAWNRMNISDIQHSIDCGVDIIHISVPSSDLQIAAKLKKDRKWILDQLKRCVYFAREHGFTVNVGMEDASRADLAFLLELCSHAFAEGAQMVRYADTVGILSPERILAEISYLKTAVPVDMGFHGHNDFGLAVANSLAAVQGGANYVDCTIGGIGERAGNCDYLQFMKAVKECLQVKVNPGLETIKQVEQEIMKILGAKA